MAAGIADPEIRARTLTAYTDLGQLLVAAGLKGTADVAALLTNRAGRILWRASGAHDAASQAALEHALGLA